MSVNRRRIRIAANLADFNTATDNVTNRQLQTWRNNDLQLEIGLFDGVRAQESSWLTDLSTVQSVTAQIKTPASGDKAPDSDAASLADVTVVAFDTPAFADWEAGTAEHVYLRFTAAQLALDPGKKWLVVHAVTDAGRVTLAAGLLEIVGDGGNEPTNPAPAGTTYLNLLEGDARYFNKVVDVEAVAPDASNEFQVDFNDNGKYRILSVSADVTLTATGYEADKAKPYSLRIVNTSGTDRTITVPAGWNWVGSEPGTVLANEWVILEITSQGAAESDVYAVANAQN